MKKFFLLCLAASSVSGCGTLHNALGDPPLQQKQLANGNAVYVDFNVLPTADWRCAKVGAPFVKNWAMATTEAQFHFTNAPSIIMQKALDNANQQNLSANYINITTPTVASIGRINVTPTADAVATYYQCEKIDPDHKLGVGS